MQNAHLQFGQLEYHRITEKASTRIRVGDSSNVGEDEQTCPEFHSGRLVQDVRAFSFVRPAGALS